MVPHLIHAFWRSEDDLDIPRDVARNLGAWRATHPLYQLKIWSLAELRPILAETPGAEEAVDTCRFIAMQADIVRLALLVAYGGVPGMTPAFWLSPSALTYVGSLPRFGERNNAAPITHANLPL